MDLADLLQDDRSFRVIVNNRTFFHEPLFPILELVRCCRQWLKCPNGEFIYNTIESEENPLLTFRLHDSKWKVYSVWQKFECEQTFTLEEVKSFLKDIVSQVIE